MNQNNLIIAAIFLFFFTINSVAAQNYNNYIGAGQSIGVKVTTSDSNNNAIGENTIGGQGLNSDEFGASRFLAQATLGATYEDIDQLNQMGYEPWIDAQFNIPADSYLQNTEDIFWEAVDLYIQDHGAAAVEGNQDIQVYSGYFRYAWWHTNMTTTDLLRHKVALALSEILVVSAKSNLADAGRGLGSYYDVLYQNAFGNYRDILYNTTLHPAMGVYLSHFNNPKSDIANNIHPDENYAREVMQLFSIGLYELNPDGSQKLDAYAKPIPTYNNADIREFAKVFTGLGPGAYWNPWEDYTVYPLEFGGGMWITDMTVPMKMYEEEHEAGAKNLLNGFVVPAGQTGLEDISDAIDNIFNHPNVGPFIGRKLIQHMVKSNPSPAYIERVAAAFENNGSGVRGDMQAVIKAILLDPEARDCEWIDDIDSGKLREPLVRYTHLLKAFNPTSPVDKFWSYGWLVDYHTQQHPFESPSVFNFFLPDYQPNGAISNAGLVAPEFQLHTSTTSVGYINMINFMTFWEYYLGVSTISDPDDVGVLISDEPNDYISVDRTDEEALVGDPDALMDRLDLILTHGNLSQGTRDIIINTLNQMYPDDEYGRLNMALYLLMISPDYAVLK